MWVAGFFIRDVTCKIRNNKDTSDGKWFMIAPRSITSVTGNNLEMFGIIYSIIYPLHYPSLQWWCMPPNVQKPLKKHEHAFEMHFSPEPLCNIGKITCVSCCTSPPPRFLTMLPSRYWKVQEVIVTLVTTVTMSRMLGQTVWKVIRKLNMFLKLWN